MLCIITVGSHMSASSLSCIQDSGLLLSQFVIAARRKPEKRYVSEEAVEASFNKTWLASNGPGYPGSAEAL